MGQIIPRAVRQVALNAGRQVRGGGINKIPHIHVDHHHAEQNPTRCEYRRGRPQRANVRYLDLALLPVEVDVGQVDLPLLQFEDRLKIVAITLGLQLLGRSHRRPAVHHVHVHQFPAVVGYTDVTQLVILRPRLSQGGENSLQARSPELDGTAFFRVNSLIEGGQKDVLHGWYAGQEQTVPAQRINVLGYSMRVPLGPVPGGCTAVREVTTRGVINNEVDGCRGAGDDENRRPKHEA